MTTSLPVFDFSTTPEERAAENAKIDAAVVCMVDNKFTRAMPDDIKYDTTIDTITAYRKYLNTKPWLSTNYLRIPSRKPSFIV